MNKSEEESTEDCAAEKEINDDGYPQYPRAEHRYNGQKRTDHCADAFEFQTEQSKRQKRRPEVNGADDEGTNENAADARLERLTQFHMFALREWTDVHNLLPQPLSREKSVAS